MERVPNDFYTSVYDDSTIEVMRKEFSRLHDEHYLDHAGATLYSETQIKRIGNDMLTSLYANPHSAGTAGFLSHEIVERTRYRLLDHFHASPDEYELVFTSGATAALKIVADTFRFRDVATRGQETGSFIHLVDNHTSVLGMRDLVTERGGKVSCLSREKAFKIFAESSQPKITQPTKQWTNSLFVYSAQCNFTGFKYPLSWIRKVQDGILDFKNDGNSGKWHVLLDAAAYAATNDLDLSKFKPDFVALSFYKMFGYPTGTGALLVRKSSADALQKIYYGGGTVNLALSLKNFHVKRDVFHERFEDGTLPFLSIISLQHGLDALALIPLDDISRHVFSLARYLHHSLATMHHRNKKPVAKIYSDTNYENRETQGGIVSFNLLRSSGDYVGYTEIVNMASLFKIYLRTGCFCNPGTCQRQLGLSDEDVMNNFEAGYTCGGSRDLINGKPTGAVRISFGYMSSREDVEAVLSMIRKCFLDSSETSRLPEHPANFQSSLQKLSINDESESIQNGYDAEQKEISLHGNHAVGQQLIRNGVNDVGRESVSENIGIEGNLRLSRLFIYPIKSCAAYEIKDSWPLGERGLQFDREWMIVTSSGVGLSQKQLVKLCLLQPTISREKNVLVLDYPGMPSVQVPLEITTQKSHSGELCRSRVCGHRVEGLDCGAEVSEWLSLALGRPNLRLIRQNNRKKNIIDLMKPELSFSSQAQYLLINESSVQWLLEKLPKDSDCLQETILYRFRGNMVLCGSLPFRETTWSQIQIGKYKFKVDSPCTRCQMVCIDQTTGKKTVEPLRLIAEEFHGKVQFGVYLSREKSEPVIINIGDSITVM
ncbi:molybdenum cofactor sulfurase 2 [Venturia canescens]|uniref:molybdenum cofactor sulfurase 2 n=1 Tax=Venturia canescens TaxID=32260 RepID=UPI001C9C0A18|nr:molybdenum cofactor sulfurase 2 [Venturia canescens]